ncbi:MAG TPA: acylneuraminate cytidylyltransferase family protein [Blastocatellia bacterium]
MNSRCLALITARGGSKGIPSKNIAPVAGKPLIYWTIAAAESATRLDRTVVTTDSEDIAAVARDLGAEVPFIRPAELATDVASSVDVILHAVRWLDRNEDYRPDFVMCLQPTSPLRLASDIDGAIALALNRKAESVVGVTPVSHHPYWTYRIGSDGSVTDFVHADREYGRRQDLPPAYASNGAIYLTAFKPLIESSTLAGNNTYGYVMPPERSLDVDTPWDLYLADLILKDRQSL